MQLLKPIQPKKFYLLAGLFTVTGWLWFLAVVAGYGARLSVCMFRALTGVPCPACGSTRSLLAIGRGDWALAFGFNPLGYMLGLGLLSLPVWLLIDVLEGKPRMYRALQSFDNSIRRRPILLLLLLLPVLINWIWNISKI